MNIQRQQVDRLLFSGIKGLDPIAVILIDHSKGQGSIIITCFGKAWTTFWAGMGDRCVSDFVLSCDEYYLAKNLSDVSSSEIDYESIGRRIGNDVDVTTMAYFDAELVAEYGADWRMNLPTKTSDDYLYLRRIINAVQQGLISAATEKTVPKEDTTP